VIGVKAWLNNLSLKLGIAGVMLLSSPWAYAVEQAAKSVDKGLGHSSAEQMLKMVLGLILVLCIIFALAWLMRRYGAMGFGGSGELRAVAGVAVGQKERVVLLQVGRRQILVGVAPGRVDMLHAIEKGEEIELSQEPQTVGKQFADKLKASMSRLEKQ
jgi:flagellar protein FliO/FliZ